MKSVKVLFVAIFLAFPLLGWEYYHNGSLESLTPLTQRGSSNTVYFLNSRNQKIGASNTFLFLPKSKECEEKILKKYKFRYTHIGNIIKAFAKNPKEAFELAKKIYESGCVEFSHPDFILPAKRRFDTLFDPQQWNFYNYGQFYSQPDIDMNVYEAWLYSRGKDIKVAIIDDGFDTLHPDLKEAFFDTYNAIDGSKNVMSDEYNYHGTLCAGLIGAKKNGIGVIGAAPDALLVGIKLIDADSTGEAPIYITDIIKSFLYAQNCDVISCSWGTYDVADSVRYIIDKLSKEGREGRGIPIVFANGNDGEPMYYWEYDESALESVIAIGAVTNLGEHPWYSNYGPALDFVAPSGGGTVAIATTDARGPIGLAKGYYGHPDYAWATDLTGFNGTSAAAPQVAGAIALMLARNPKLTKEQVVNILKKSAKKVGEFAYINGRNDFFGYGLVDAKAAVEESIRMKVKDEIENGSFPIQGYFVHYGPDRFDWIYVTSSLKFAAKLEGMDENGYLQWRELNLENLDFLDDGVVLYLSQSDPLFFELSGKLLPISGYFIHYASGAYDWIYLPKDTLSSYKLEGLDYNGNFLWIDLGISAVKEGDKILF